MIHVLVCSSLINKPHHLGHRTQRAEALSPTVDVVEITPARLKSQDSRYLQKKVHWAAQTIFFSFLKNVSSGKGCTEGISGFHYLGEFIPAFARYSYQYWHVTQIHLFLIEQGTRGFWNFALIHFLLNDQQWQLYQSPLNSKAAVYFFMPHCLSPPCCLLNCKLFVAEKPFVRCFLVGFFGQYPAQWGMRFLIFTIKLSNTHSSIFLLLLYLYRWYFRLFTQLNQTSGTSPYTSFQKLCF